MQEPAVIFEHSDVDGDGARFFVYTVAGWLDGENVATIHGGVTIGGDVIVILADNREDADDMACMGLQDTIDALNNEDAMMIDAAAAQARLSTIGALDRLDLSIRSDKNEDFVNDVDAIRPLIGDDIILTSGH